MGAQADVIFGCGAANCWMGSHAPPIETPAGVIYIVYQETSTSDIAFIKSTDGGLSWSTPIIVIACAAINHAVWYDKWTPGLSGGLIHIVVNDTTTDDVIYRTIDTENSDTLSTQTNATTTGATSVTSSQISITRTRGGNVVMRAMIDAGAELFTAKLPNANVPNGAWSAIANNEAVAAGDHGVLVPGFAADNNDCILIFWDASANEVSRYLYDDSANTWAETSIATSMAEAALNGLYPNLDAIVDIANSRIIVAAWSAVDLVNADLRLWHVTESAITEQTNVVLNSTDDQGGCNLSISADGMLHCFYGGKTDGSETIGATAASHDFNYYKKVSADFGSTWGAETQVTERRRLGRNGGFAPCQSYRHSPIFISYDDAGNSTAQEVMRISLARDLPRFRSQVLGG